MIKKIVVGLSTVGALLAFNLDSAVNELSCKKISFNSDMAGMYKEFDEQKNLWFLYMPKLNYLLVHKTGKNNVADGAEIVKMSDFTSIPNISGADIKFGNYNGTDSKVSELSNQAFKIDGDMAGMYKEFDKQKNLWFLYMPKLNYLLIHETGKYTTKDGAKIVKVSDYFKSIDVVKDPFGNPTGEIEFISKDGCGNENSSTGASSSINSGSSSSGSGSTTSPVSVIYPPAVPNVSDSSGVVTPPSVPPVTN